MTYTFVSSVTVVDTTPGAGAGIVMKPQAGGED